MDLIEGVSAYPARVPGVARTPRVQHTTICRACAKHTVRVTYSRRGKLGRTRKRACTECGWTLRTLETEILPGLKRAIRRLIAAQGVQLELPFE